MKTVFVKVRLSTDHRKALTFKITFLRIEQVFRWVLNESFLEALFFTLWVLSVFSLPIASCGVRFNRFCVKPIDAGLFTVLNLNFTPRQSLSSNLSVLVFMNTRKNNTNTKQTINVFIKTLYRLDLGKYGNACRSCRHSSDYYRECDFIVVLNV